MITLAVVAFNDTPADGTLQVRFDELGGSIGRAGTNQLVLPDPERAVSRVAAQVVYRNGAFALVERGSNPVSINGRALGSGREAPITNGDRIRICGYEISVKVGATRSAGPSDPFSGLFGPAKTATPGKPLDPLAQPRVATAAPAESEEAGGIPADWDPFATAVPPRPGGGAAPRQRDALGLDVGSAAPESLVPGFGAQSATPSSLDQLFGLKPSAGGDPLSNSPLDAPMSQPNMAGSDDPLRALQSAPRAVEAALPDQMSDLQRPYIPPTMIKPPAQASRPALPQVRPPAEAASEQTRAQPAAAPPRPAPRAAAAPAPTTPAVSAQLPPTARAGAAAARPPASEGTDALLAAFRRGLDAPALELPSLTPALMELVGQLLHASVQGTLELLHTRAAVKQGLHSEVTAIVAGKNNPLKFSPSVDVALQHLLSPPARGFMPAGAAMQDAYADLRTHQFAYAVGMRATLEAALQRFDPAQIEGRLGDRSSLRDLLPASRNARLWELFVEHYGRVRKDAAGDFHAAFGHVFLKAYDDHVRRLEDQRNAERTEP